MFNKCIKICFTEFYYFETIQSNSKKDLIIISVECFQKQKVAPSKIQSAQCVLGKFPEKNPVRNIEFEWIHIRCYQCDLLNIQ